MLYPLYRISLRNRWTAVGLWIVFLILNILPITGITQFLCLNRLPKYLVYFYTGILISNFKLEEYLATWQMLSLTGVLFILAEIFWPGFGTSMTGSLFFWGLAVKIDKFITFDLFGSFRNYTFQIFLISIFAQIFIKILYQRFDFPGSFTVFYLICILAGLYVPVIISKIIKKTDVNVLRMACGL